MIILIRVSNQELMYLNALKAMQSNNGQQFGKIQQFQKGHINIQES